MSRSYTELYVHLVWGTWDRRPLLSTALEERIHGAIAQKCRDLGCPPLAVGGTVDHVHLLVALAPTLSIAALAGSVKGWSSYLVTQNLSPGALFRWQGGYGAFTLRKSDLPTVKRYIENQKQHHAHETADPDWEPPPLE